MKKIVLHKITQKSAGKNYVIRYDQELNARQYDAVMHTNGAALVIAGAGTGKTRTLVYRVARLIEDGIPPESVLLLTFTRKSAQEMLRRAVRLLDGRCEKVSGGTFHSFANTVLRQYASLLGFERNFTILDQSDSQDVINVLRAQKGLDTSKRRFPYKQTLFTIASASVNKCLKVEEIIELEFPQYKDDTEAITQLIRDYHLYKMKNNVMDYDDLLLFLMKLIHDSPDVASKLHAKYKHLMVDEYQDTNILQHQIVCALAGKHENVMAVGDDAQSIYSFRGANYENIMRFPESFSSCAIIPIEENYRSTQQILDVSNEVIGRAAYRYNKNLFTTVKFDGDKPALICAKDDKQQSEFVVQQILELRESGISLDDIAILFRSGFTSFDVEIELTKANIPFVKYGGLKLMDTSHIKDVLALVRILINPSDLISWNRILLLLEGIGQRTAAMILEQLQLGTLRIDGKPNLDFLQRGKKSVQLLFDTLNMLFQTTKPMLDVLGVLSEYYRPILKEKHDDWQKRWRDIEMFLSISQRYTTLEQMMYEIALNPPIATASELLEEDNETEHLTLSTIHSAKGLEWDSVFLITALEGRFPSSKSEGSLEQLEEERRLMYVALTRAKNRLYISYPSNIFDRETGQVLACPTRFIDGISEEILDKYVLSEEEEQDKYLELPENERKKLLN